jgi:hypothetical protein
LDLGSGFPSSGLDLQNKSIKNYKLSEKRDLRHFWGVSLFHNLSRNAPLWKLGSSRPSWTQKVAKLAGKHRGAEAPGEIFSQASRIALLRNLTGKCRSTQTKFSNAVQ